MIWIFRIWVFVVVWILVWREREGQVKIGTTEKRVAKKREINGKLMVFRDQIDQF